jgi:hypothetical protein
MEVFDSAGYGEQYDYIYFPLDRHSSCNKGYGFIHFTKVEHAYDFMKTLNGYKFPNCYSEKSLRVCVAKRQGVLESLVACVKTSSSTSDSRRRGRQMQPHPWVRVNGKMACCSPRSAIRVFADKVPGGVADPLAGLT